MRQRRWARRSSRLAVAITAAALAAAPACALVLGIEDRRPRLDDDDAAPSGDVVADAGSGADTCSTPSPQNGCRCETHDFCEDFDMGDGAAPFARWQVPLGVPPNPITFGSADSATMTTSSNALSPAFSSRAAINSASESTTAAVALHQLSHANLHPGRSFVGVRLTFFLQVDELAFVDPTDPDAAPRGAIPDAASAAVGAIVRPVLPSQAAAALVLTNDSVYLVVTSDVFKGTTNDSFSRIYPGSVRALGGVGWVAAEILITDRERAIALGYTSCENIPAGTGAVAAAGLLPTTFKKCLALPTALADLSSWSSPAIVAGAVVFNEGHLVIRHDNVAVDFLE